MASQQAGRVFVTSEPGFQLFEITQIKGLDFHPAKSGQTWVTYKEKPLKLDHERVILSTQVFVPQANTKTFTPCYIELISHYIVCKMV